MSVRRKGLLVRKELYVGILWEGTNVHARKERSTKLTQAVKVILIVKWRGMYS